VNKMTFEEFNNLTEEEIEILNGEGYNPYL
jgi:hypothetical protein